jgi:hypothetical protein
MDPREIDVRITQEDHMNDPNSDIAALWNLMTKTGAGVMKVVLDANGVPASRMMILVDGVREVQEIKAAVTDLEDEWEAEREDNAGTEWDN